MSKDNVRSWDATAANNTDIGGTDITGTTGLVKNGDNAIREAMAQIAEMVDELGYPTAGGTANALTLTPATAVTAYASGDVWTFKATSANTGATTLNISGVGAKAIRKIVGGTDVALAANDILAGVRYGLVYDSTANSSAGAFIIVSSNVYDAAYPAGHLYGLTLSNNVSDATNDIDIAVGSARDDTNTVNMALASALTKRLDAAWAVGTNQGGLDTGSIANATYHVFLIKRSDTGVVDALLSTSATAPTMPTNYDFKRRIGSIIRLSGAIVAFVQDGDNFELSAPDLTVNASAPGTSAVTRTMSVPTGIRVAAKLGVGFSSDSSSTDFAVLVTDLSCADSTPTVTLADVVFQSPSTAGIFRLVGPKTVMTNTSAQVRTRINFSSANTALRIFTYGWIDTRGRNS